MIEPEDTVIDVAAKHWSVAKDPCLECCGPWIAGVLVRARQAALGTEPVLSLSSDEPVFESIVIISLGGCEHEPDVTAGEREDCLENYEDVLDAAASALTTASAFTGTMTTALADAEADLSTAETAVPTALDAMVTDRTAYAALQRDLLGARIKEETLLNRGDTAGAAAAVAEQDSINADLAAHAYNDSLLAYEEALFNLAVAQGNVYDAQASLKEAIAAEDLATLVKDCAQHNVTVSVDPEVEVWGVFEIVSSSDRVPALRTSGTRRAGFYAFGFDVTERQGFTTADKPLPTGSFSLKFQWREVTIPEDGSEYTYSDPIEEIVEVTAGTRFVQTSDHEVEVPAMESRIKPVTMPQAAVVDVEVEELEGSAFIRGFMAYKHAGSVAQLYSVETASGSNEEETFSGSQEVDEAGEVTTTFNATVQDDYPDRISSLWSPGGIGVPTSPLQEPTAVTATSRAWANGMVMTLSESVTIEAGQAAVDAYVGGDFGEPFPGTFDTARLPEAHCLLFTGETVYSRRRLRRKLSVTIPATRPFAIDIEVKWNERTLDWGTKAWSLSEESTVITVPAGELTATETDWTEYDPPLGTLLRITDLRAEPHPHLWRDGADVTVEPPA